MQLTDCRLFYRQCSPARLRGRCGARRHWWALDEAMSLMRALLAKFVQFKPRLQEELDIRKLYDLLYYTERCMGNETGAFKPRDASYSEQFRLVHSAVTKQLISHLRLLSGATPPPSTGEPLVGSTSENSPLPFHLTRCSPSKQRDISGVFLHGCAAAGTVVCFYPGTVYLPTDLQDIPHFPDISKDNPYLMSHSDGSVIDAKEFTTEDKRRQWLAEGHMVRHPQAGHEANVMPFSYNVSPSFPKDLVPLIPNKYHKYPGLLYYSKSPMRTVVFVAVRDINNEELFLNYRLHPDSELPSWYTSVDDEEAKRRWRY